MKFDIENYLSTKKLLVEQKLQSLLIPGEDSPTKLEESICYSVLAGGKRLRPILMLASTEAVGGDICKALPVACALEMIHTYSLIHDDLPSMDDDDLRRGVPTNHTVYGEATAILAGDSLLTDAFYVIANEGNSCGIPPGLITEIISDISAASGSRGMIKGQAIDLELQGKNKVTIDQVEAMHSLKTGALIETAVLSGAKIGGANRGQLSKLQTYANAVGLAFQIIDDVLDIEGGGEIGKSPGADARNGKSTYPEVAGLEQAKLKAAELTEQAVNVLQDFGDNALPLKEIALYLGARNH